MNNSLYQAPELYDAEFGGYRADVPFYEHVLERHPGVMVEAGCGTGRLYFYVQPDAYIGVDASWAMLRRFKARSRRKTPRLTVGDLTALPLATHSGAVTVLCYNVLQHMMTPEKLTAALAEAARVSPWVALDTFMPPLPGMVRRDEGFLDVEQRRHPDGSILEVTEQTHFDESHGVQLTKLKFADGKGQAPVHTVTRRLWDHETIRRGIAGAGLRISELYGDVDKTAWNERAPRFMAVCTRT